jgi:hypothetical protein
VPRSASRFSSAGAIGQITLEHGDVVVRICGRVTAPARRITLHVRAAHRRSRRARLGSVTAPVRAEVCHALRQCAGLRPMQSGPILLTVAHYGKLRRSIAAQCESNDPPVVEPLRGGFHSVGRCPSAGTRRHELEPGAASDDGVRRRGLVTATSRRSSCHQTLRRPSGHRSRPGSFPRPGGCGAPCAFAAGWMFIWASSRHCWRQATNSFSPPVQVNNLCSGHS